MGTFLSTLWSYIGYFVIAGLLGLAWAIYWHWHRLQRVAGVVKFQFQESITKARAAWHTTRAADTAPRSVSETAPPATGPSTLSMNTAPVAPATKPAIAITPVPARILPGFYPALEQTPSVIGTARFIREHYPKVRFPFPYGWRAYEARSGGHIADLVLTDLATTNAIAFVAPSQYSKTSTVLAGFMILTMWAQPDHLQFAIFDRKRTDFRGMRNSDYTWLMAEDVNVFPKAFARIEAEIERRKDLFEQLDIYHWDQYTGNDAPLLVVYISELSAVAEKMGLQAVDRLLNSLMSHSAAFGIRVIVDTHHLANYSTLWRKQLSDRMLGPGIRNPQYDLVNADMDTETILRLGAIPPSRFPNDSHKGVYTLISSDGSALTLRAVYPSIELRREWFSRLPKRIPSITIEAPQDDTLLMSDEAVEDGYTQPLLIATLETAAVLYAHGEQLNTILELPHVHDELRTLCATIRKRDGTPNIRQITWKLFGLPAKSPDPLKPDGPSGEMQSLVKAKAQELGFLEVESDAQVLRVSTTEKVVVA